MSDWKPTEEKPLKGVARCKKTDCEKQLHCFLKDKRRRTPEGTCLNCGASLVDWARVHRRDLRDLTNTVTALRYEHIRHEFWCALPLSERALRFARKLGKLGVYLKAKERIEKKLMKPGKWADYGQVPFEDKADAIHFAQHATATCCRRCIEVWHGIARDQILSQEDVEYFAQLILRYVVDRIPDLTEEATVPTPNLRISKPLRTASQYAPRS